MTQVDIARVALGAPALQQVFVVSRPECLLVKAWARNERSNTEDAAALVGNLFRDCDDALQAVGGTKDARVLMVEASDRVLVVSRVAEDMAAAFVFEQSAPLGLIRVQARQLTAQLARNLAADPSRAIKTGDLPTVRPGAAEQGPLSNGRPQEPTPAFGIPATPKSPAHGIPAVGAPGERSPAFGVPQAQPAVAPGERSPAFGVPTAQPSAPGSERSPAFGVPQAQPAAAPGERSPAFGVPSAQPGPTEGGPARPQRSSKTIPEGQDRLSGRIAAFMRAANDARSALLRLSLRTGLPMELLEQPTHLSKAQAELVHRALEELKKKS